jgi:hypothetical protein
MAIIRKNRPTLPKLNGKPSGQKKTHGHQRRDAEPKPKPPTDKKVGPDGKEKRGKWGKKPKPEADSDDSGYDEAPVASDGEEEGFGFDLTSSLAGTSTMSRFKPVRPAAGASKAKANGKPAAMEISDEEEEAGEVDEDEDAEIMAMMGKKSLKDGATAVKTVMGKGKGKEAKTMVGGGSWQSMGEFPFDLNAQSITKSALLRPGAATPSFASPPRLQNPHTNPTCLHPARHRPTTARPRRHGPNRFR